MVNNGMGMIFDIKRFAVHDGPGIRTTVFLKGCPLQCWWCHNPEGISCTKDIMFFEYKCIGCRTCASVCPAGAITFQNDIHHIEQPKCTACGICSETCPTSALKLVGRMIAVEELIHEIEKDILLYDNSEGGITFSGGEPLLQHKFLKETLKQCKKRLLHTALDTSGYAFRDVFLSVLDYVDTFLFDLKLADEKEHKKYTGVSNAAIKENLRMLSDIGRGKDVILRFPVISGITDTERNIEGLLKFVIPLREKGIERIDLLPFHDVSEKYQRLRKAYKMPVDTAPGLDKLNYIKDCFEKIGFNVKI